MSAILLFFPVLIGLWIMSLGAIPIAFGDRPVSTWMSNPGRWIARGLLIIAALVHSSITAWLWMHPEARAIEPFGRWLALDQTGLYFLSITSLLFFIASLYSAGYLYRETVKYKITLWIEAVFIACLLFFLSTMTLITFSRSFEVLWVAVEASTLVSAPLIYFHRHQNSLEATWKYMIICSSGIAMALLGTFFVAVSGSLHGAHHGPLFFDRLLSEAGQLDRQWLKAAFIFLLVGYGTKMGLAPLHSWLPDAHSEAPSNVSAMLSGALLNCAFLGILRICQVCGLAGETEFTSSLLIAFGLLSMAFAAVFIIKQADYKRLLAYSSVEHMGILALAIGLGGAATFGGMLHAVNHSMTKAMLFLVSGNILATYHSKSTRVVFGIRRVLPASGALWFIGLFAITGSPPFGTFISEFIILKAAITQGHMVAAVIYLAALAIIFIGMINVVLKMLQGLPADTMRPPHDGEPLWSVVPPAALALGVLVLGVYIPPFLNSRLIEIAGLLGGGGIK